MRSEKIHVINTPSIRGLSSNRKFTEISLIPKIANDPKQESTHDKPHAHHPSVFFFFSFSVALWWTSLTFLSHKIAEKKSV